MTEEEGVPPGVCDDEAVMDGATVDEAVAVDVPEPESDSVGGAVGEFELVPAGVAEAEVPYEVDAVAASETLGVDPGVPDAETPGASDTVCDCVCDCVDVQVAVRDWLATSAPCAKS